MGGALNVGGRTDDERGADGARLPGLVERPWHPLWSVDLVLLR